MFLEIDLQHEILNLNNTDKNMIEKKAQEDSVNLFKFSSVSNNKRLKPLIELDMNNYFENNKLNKPSFNLVSIFASYLNLCYYFGVIPYNVKFDTESGLWTLKTSITQKVNLLQKI